MEGMNRVVEGRTNNGSSGTMPPRDGRENADDAVACAEDALEFVEANACSGDAAGESASFVQAMKKGRMDMARRCAEAAERMITEAGVKHVTWSDKSLRGRACPEYRSIYVPRPTTRRRLYVIGHECGHVVLGHTGIKPRHREEYEAERYAQAAMKRQGIPVPRKSVERAKEYVAWKIHQAVRRGAKQIDSEALNWCRKYLSSQVEQWLANGRGLRR